MVKRKILLDRELVYVDFHKDEGYTHLRSKQARRSFDIPTKIIPHHLRAIGSDFFLTEIFEYPETKEESKPYSQWYVRETLESSDLT